MADNNLNIFLIVLLWTLIFFGRSYLRPFFKSVLVNKSRWFNLEISKVLLPLFFSTVVFRLLGIWASLAFFFGSSKADLFLFIFSVCAVGFICDLGFNINQYFYTAIPNTNKALILYRLIHSIVTVLIFFWGFSKWSSISRVWNEKFYPLLKPAISDIEKIGFIDAAIKKSELAMQNRLDALEVRVNTANNQVIQLQNELSNFQTALDDTESSAHAFINVLLETLNKFPILTIFSLFSTILIVFYLKSSIWLALTSLWSTLWGTSYNPAADFVGVHEGQNELNNLVENNAVAAHANIENLHENVGLIVMNQENAHNMNVQQVRYVQEVIVPGLDVAAVDLAQLGMHQNRFNGAQVLADDRLQHVILEVGGLSALLRQVYTAGFSNMESIYTNLSWKIQNITQQFRGLIAHYNKNIAATKAKIQALEAEKVSIVKKYNELEAKFNADHQALLDLQVEMQARIVSQQVSTDTQLEILNLLMASSA